MNNLAPWITNLITILTFVILIGSTIGEIYRRMPKVYIYDVHYCSTHSDITHMEVTIKIENGWSKPLEISDIEVLNQDEKCIDSFRPLLQRKNKSYPSFTLSTGEVKTQKFKLTEIPKILYVKVTSNKRINWFSKIKLFKFVNTKYQYLQDRLCSHAEENSITIS